ncbi:MAG TPA: tetratricopeptide repeat protein [Terriglobales bacterium]|nr:tetratricopeptide repeat protein [Terriglobales bacterium]
MPEHISRKELKQDKIRESIEHGAEAVYSHSRTATVIILVALIAAGAYFGWNFYTGRQNLQASAALDAAMKTFNAPLRSSAPPGDTSETIYPSEDARADAASGQFLVAANKYPNTNPGRLSRYYAALCLEDLGRFNQALEELKKLAPGKDKELAAMAQYQMANIYARTGKTDDAVKAYRAVADMHAVLVPRPLALLELADLLRQKSPAEAAGIYQQVKNEYPNSPVADRADRGLNLLSSSPKT